LLPIINCELFWHAKHVDDLLLEKLSDSGWSDGSDRPPFNPLGEILDDHHSDLEIALSCG
jgi:hypothetical protein